MPTNPVAFPMSELVLQDVVDTLSAVSTNANYLTDLLVEREKQGGNTPRDGLCVVIGGDPIPQPSAPVQFEEFLLPVGICVYVTESERSSVPITQRLYQAAADVRRALLADIHRGLALAVNTEFDEADRIYSESEIKHVMVTAKVRYRHRYGDPYTRT